MKVIEADLLINSRARKGRRALPGILGACNDQGIDVGTVHRLLRKTNLDNLIAKIKKDQPKLLIICGGDGTLSSIIGRLAGAEIEIGIIPLGTTNNFARSLSLPFDIAQAIKVIKDSAPRPVDLGKLGSHYFTNVAGVGLSARVAESVGKKHKKIFGRYAYILVGIFELVRHRPFLATIEDSDSNLQFRLETHQIVVANGRHHGGKEIAEDVAVNSGEVVIFSLGGRSKFSFMVQALKFYLGSRRSVRNAPFLVGKDINIRTNSNQPIEIDGEVRAESPVSISVAPGAIRIRHNDGN